MPLTNFSSAPSWKSLLNFSHVFLYELDSLSSTLSFSAAFPFSTATRLSIFTRTYSVTWCSSSKEVRLGRSSLSSHCQS